MKRKLALLATIPLMLTSFAITGCKEEPTSEQIVLCDFEQFEPDFQLMRLQGEFGAVNVNTDRNYVKSGKTSAKLQPIGGYTSKSKPYFYLQTFSNNYGYDYSDFTKIKSFSTWIYNAQPDSQLLEVGVIGDIISTTSCTKTQCTRYSLQSGWNKVVVYVDHDKLAFSLDLSDIRGIYFGFENAGIREVENAPVYYMDDVTLTTFATPIEINDNYEFAKGEIADFESDYQSKMILYQNTKDTSMPEAYIVKAENEGLTAPNGQNILKVVTKGDEVASGWPSILIPQKILESCGFTQIPVEERMNYVFRFEVYVTVPNFRLWSILYAQSGAQGKKELTEIEVGKWVTIEIPFNEAGIYPGQSDEKIKATTENILTKPAKWAINWGGYNDAEEKVFYLDNFRYEKIS